MESVPGTPTLLVPTGETIAISKSPALPSRFDAPLSLTELPISQKKNSIGSSMHK